MKIKLPITDRFLWMVYEVFEKTGETLEPPEVFRLRSWQNIVPLGAELWKALERKRRKRQFEQFINYLKSQGYIEIANLKEKKGILLTPRGHKKALKVKYLLKPEKGELKRRKDKKWVMIIFDIPEKKRKYRDELRGFLYSLGFKSLQKSVWVSPYNILKELREIIKILKLESFVKIFLIEEPEL